MSTDTSRKADDMAELRASIDKLTKDVSALSHSLTDIVKTRAGQVADDISDKGKQSKAAVEETIRERPFQSLAAAFGAGLLIAQLLRKRSPA